MSDARPSRVIPLVSPLVAEYIARQLLRGTYSSLHAVSGCHFISGDGGRVRDDVDSLLDGYAQLMTRHALSQHRLAAPREQQMQNVIQSLKQHSIYEPGLQYDLDGVLPPFIHQTNDLLIPPPFTPFGREDALCLALAKWFKESFMRWIDPIKCPQCGGATEMGGMVDRTDAEKQDGAGQVENHICVDEGCRGVRRFPRYGRVRPLLRTREGRCGEWAHLFYVLLQAVGLSARYVWNSEDHVWAEYWSPALKHWVHVDPCEAVVNKPLLYVLGWGKKQAFCIAVGRYGAEDVTRVYVDDWNGACRGRRAAYGWNEKALKIALLKLTVELRFTKTPEDITRLEAMDTMQAMWMADGAGRLAEARREELGGRTSGTADWRAKRQELGLQKVSKPHYAVVKSLHVTMKDLEVKGDARAVGDTILLTSQNSQTSAVFHPTPLDQKTDFRCQVTFRLTSPPGAGEADGLAVVFTPERKVGLGGYGLGYSGLGDKGDFAVEIDTYRTRDHADDPPTPHISVHSPPNAHHRHSIACTPPDSIPFLSDGREYTLELMYNGTTRLVLGFLTLPPDGGEQGTEVDLWEVVVPPGEGKAWYVGITGSCGGLWQKQEVLKWSMEEIQMEEGREPGLASSEPTEADAV